MQNRQLTSHWLCSVCDVTCSVSTGRVLCPHTEVILVFLVKSQGIKMSKPARAKNVTEEEKLILMDIVNSGETIDIVESKKYDADSVKAKNEVWRKIEVAYNSRSPIARDIKQLSKKWRDMKKKAKDIRTEQKKESRLTGGGKNPVQVDPVSQAAMSILPSTSFDPLAGVNDSDALLHEDVETTENGEFQ